MSARRHFSPAAHSCGSLTRQISYTACARSGYFVVIPGHELFLIELERISMSDLQQTFRIYRALPTLAAIIFFALCTGLFFLTGSYLIAGAIATLPAGLLLWRWSVAGRTIDRWAAQWICPRCGASIKKRMAWSYPPSSCPSCNQAIST